MDGSVEQGDSVVVVGGGRGVTTVKASKKVGESGKVTVYEGSNKEIQTIRSTIKQNQVPSQIDLVHAIVGEEINLYNESHGAARLTPEELPQCDVLELDCEGSEIEILQNLAIQPRVILVETHGLYDAPSAIVENLLREMQYSIKSKNIAVNGPGLEHCRENDIYVLVAIQE